MHDGIHLELAGVPAAVVCTDRFASTGRAMVKVWGAPDYPLAVMPHPLSSRTVAELELLAQKLTAQVAAVLTGGASQESDSGSRTTDGGQRS